ncbi:unnamed protein product [Penicillium pancosmium]
MYGTQKVGDWMLQILQSPELWVAIERVGANGKEVGVSGQNQQSNSKYDQYIYVMWGISGWDYDGEDLDTNVTEVWEECEVSAQTHIQSGMERWGFAAMWNNGKNSDLDDCLNGKLKNLGGPRKRPIESKNGVFEIVEFWDEDIPEYAILSHTWVKGEEVSLQEMSGPDPKSKKGYKKIEQCCEMAKAEGLDYAWVDTCCIDKTSSAELSEAINSMYYWYEQAAVCYAFLADVPTEKPFEKSRWFSRGWTLQELIAPSKVIFLDEGWTMLEFTADRQKMVAESTGIPVDILLHKKDLDEFSIAQRMSWASGRQTSRIEDRAYSLMGLFGINMPLIYGEKEMAFIRLQQGIMKISNDYSIFAWRSKDSLDGFPTSPAAFAESYNIVQTNPSRSLGDPFTVDNQGVHLTTRAGNGNSQLQRNRQR